MPTNVRFGAISSGYAAFILVLLNCLSHIFFGFGLEVSEIVNLRSVSFDDGEHLIFAFALKRPGAFITNIFAREVPAAFCHNFLLHNFDAAKVCGWDLSFCCDINPPALTIISDAIRFRFSMPIPLHQRK
jgi:hypothetical protein